MYNKRLFNIQGTDTTYHMYIYSPFLGYNIDLWSYLCIDSIDQGFSLLIWSFFCIDATHGLSPLNMVLKWSFYCIDVTAHGFSPLKLGP